MIYENEYLKEISFPLGGIGTGSIGLVGNGALIDWEIFNRPNKGGANYYSFFAIRAELPDGTVDTRILQGDCIEPLTGQYLKKNFCGYGFGPNGGTMAGFPHFRSVVFDGRYPIATLTFSDPDFPAEVTLTALNPFIPQDADASSIPAAFFDISVNSRTDGVRYSAILSVQNPFPLTENLDTSTEDIASVTLRHAGSSRDAVDHGDVTAAVRLIDEKILQRCWYRSGWQQDFIDTFWHEFNRGELRDRTYDTPGDSSLGRGDIATVGTSATARAGEALRFSFVISWNVPNCYNYWSPCKDEDGRDVIWKNYYATLFKDSGESALYSLKNFDELYKRTADFRDSLHGSTLDPAVIDAASSTLSVLRSPTVLRLSDGTFYGWEGVHQLAGSCEGTCTHVWSYAYALCFLFPELERSIRETEFTYDTAPDGKMSFRTSLPRGREPITDHACLDGQMASVIKTYREWKISGDTEWLRKYWPSVKSVLEYAWSESNADAWDRDRDGVLEGRQHHTLDMELFGPSGWLQGMYLAALRAAAEMAEHLGDSESAELYRSIFESGYAFTRDELFNGRYYIQKIDISDPSPTERFGCPNYWNTEKGQLKYQINDGCEIDQLLGQWHASLCGLGDVFDKDRRAVALKNMYSCIYKPSMRDFTNTWRVFALDDEGGAVMCDYPEGSAKPVIPIAYHSECMTGFEYAFAGLLISEGFTDEGLSIVRSVRDRYDGKKRNPWNEIECGSNYARAMASFALLPIFSGFEFDMTRGHVGFSPIEAGDFRCLWSLGRAWGDYVRNDSGITLKIKGGAITLTSIKTGASGPISSLIIDGRPVSFTEDNGILRFPETEIKDSLTATL